MITRTLGQRLAQAAQHFPVATVTGPRQSGKTTLCRTVFFRTPVRQPGNAGCSCLRPIGLANLALVESVSQSLAGRTALLNLLLCSFDELRQFPGAPLDLLLTVWTGGYPAIFTAWSSMAVTRLIFKRTSRSRPGIVCRMFYPPDRYSEDAIDGGEHGG